MTQSAPVFDLVRELQEIQKLSGKLYHTRFIGFVKIPQNLHLTSHNVLKPQTDFTSTNTPPFKCTTLETCAWKNFQKPRPHKHKLSNNLASLRIPWVRNPRGSSSWVRKTSWVKCTTLEKPVLKTSPSKPSVSIVAHFSLGCQIWLPKHEKALTTHEL